jgi:hypothetical protein
MGLRAKESSMATRAEILAHFEWQAGHCERLGSPFTARVCQAAAEALDEGTAFGARVLGWEGEPTADALALRVAGALNGLVRSGLSRAWPTGDGDLPAAIAAAVRAHDGWLTPWLDGPPQTNEVGRSAVILGGALEIARRTGLPLEMLEIGASAGLNLHFDAWSYELGAGRRGDGAVMVRADWRGRAPDLSTPLRVAARAGVDVAPLDPADAGDRARMLAYIWPDQTERLARAEAALDYAAASGVKVAQGDAAEWVEARLSEAWGGRVRVLFHTIVWPYLPDATKARIRAALNAAGARATADAPLAWLRLEAADATAPGAAITLTIWPDGREISLGRGDFHGRWVEWTAG